MHNSDIEDNDPTPFVLEEWIGKGRQLPNAIDTPSGLEEHFSMLREVPDDIKHKCYPNTDLSIESFIKYQLPKRTYALPGLDALGCFNQREPNADLDMHTTLPLPSRQFVEKLDTHFRQATLNDMHSVINPAYPGSYLPL
ncbi:hypothetical protein BGW80DRAFT_1295800, partial [Lactifluus volemus]